jgi:hypothetical protein
MYPVSGGFYTLVSRFVDASWGFAMGWNYVRMDVQFDGTTLLTILGLPGFPMGCSLATGGERG